MKNYNRLLCKKTNHLDHNVPSDVYELYNTILSNNGTPPKGYKGGNKYRNQNKNGEEKLPKGNYKEYDVHPKIKGKNRGCERLVIERKGNAYYTDSHYKRFIQLNFLNNNIYSL